MTHKTETLENHSALKIASKAAKNSNVFTAPDREDFELIAQWIETHGCELPQNVQQALTDMLSVFSNLIQGDERAKRTLTQLRLAMGILKKSEKGSSANHSTGV